MKTEAEIREAETIIGFVARHAHKTGDIESYEIAANIAMGLKWALGESVGPGIDALLQFGIQQIRAEQERAKKNN